MAMGNGKDRKVHRKKNISYLSTKIDYCALLCCFRIPVNLITGILIKPRRGIPWKKGCDWVMRGGGYQPNTR